MSSGLRTFLRRLAARLGDPPLGDGDLLRRFARLHDGEAFAALLARHGPMVLGVCRRVLGEDDAEDAFQATFLVLAQKAGSLVGQDSVGGWLYGVAVRVARRARGRQRREEQRSRQLAAPGPASETPARPDDRLDDVLARLPWRYREPLMLCYLQGRSVEEAAAELGCSADAVRGRLHRGKEELRRRLRAEVPALAVPVLSPALSEQTLSLVSNAVLKAGGAGGLVPAVALARGVLRAMMLTRIAVWLCVMGLLGLGTASVAAFAPDGDTPVSKPLVRALKVKRVPIQLAGKDKVTVMKTKAELEKVVGKTLAAELGKQVKFATEQVVLVSYQTGGPAYGEIKYEIKGKDKKSVEFYCLEPKGARQCFEVGRGVLRVPIQLAGKDKVTVMKTKAELEKVVGKTLAAELGKQVKFATEQVVLVSYQTGGPAYGEIKYEIKGKDKKSVEFYCLEPKGARDSALKWGAEFYAVTKGTAVKYAGKK